MQCYDGHMRPLIGTSSTQYTTGKTRTPNAKYNCEPEDLGCTKFPYDPCTTTVAEVYQVNHYRLHGFDKITCTTTAVAVNDYFHDVREPLLPLLSRERLLPLRSVYHYFP